MIQEIPETKIKQLEEEVKKLRTSDTQINETINIFNDRLEDLENHVTTVAKKRHKDNWAVIALVIALSPLVIPFVFVDVTSLQFSSTGISGSVKSREFPITPDTAFMTVICGFGGLGIISKDALARVILSLSSKKIE